MFHYYLENDCLLFSQAPQQGLQKADEAVAMASEELYFLGNLESFNSRRCFVVSHPSLLFIEEEGIDLLCLKECSKDVPDWLLQKINDKKIFYLNTAYSGWKEYLQTSQPKKYRVHVIAIGDIGGTLLTGLRLLGGSCIHSIGIYDRNEGNRKRWEYEMNQTLPPFDYDTFPEVDVVDYDTLADCDVLVFCASKGYTYTGPDQDVRMAQFESNSEIVSIYAKLLREKNFKGTFAILSDPVDLLCKKALIESNTNENGTVDGRGLLPDQIRGYGLGVMNSRAVYYSKKDPRFTHYLHEGRAFGPHGKGLVIADSIDHYDDALSMELTQLALKANIEVRNTGFKPYMAPAFSSGALSIIATLSGDWHYSTTFLGGTFMGSNNRLVNRATELEQLPLPDDLFERIQASYQLISDIL